MLHLILGQNYKLTLSNGCETLHGKLYRGVSDGRWGHSKFMNTFYGVVKYVFPLLINLQKKNQSRKVFWPIKDGACNVLNTLKGDERPRFEADTNGDNNSGATSPAKDKKTTTTLTNNNMKAIFAVTLLLSALFMASEAVQVKVSRFVLKLVFSTILLIS